MADDNIRHVNCASDFRIVFAFSDGKLPDYPWRLGLKTPNTPSYNMYVASFDGTTYNNCSPLDDESIMVFVDHHRLAPGILHYYLQTDAPDSLFPDGEMNVTIPGTVNIVLWEGPSDGDTPPEVTVIVERLLKGDKGDPGEAGQITSATASIDNTTGTPSVKIELGGTPEKRTIDLKFSGLKGEPGELDESFVRYDKAQDLTTSEQEQAWLNLGLDLVVLKFPKGVTSITLTDEGDAKLQSGAAVLVTTDSTDTTSNIYNANNHIFTPIDFKTTSKPIYYSLALFSGLLHCSYDKVSKTFAYHGIIRLIDSGAIRFDRQTPLTSAQQEQALDNIGFPLVHLDFALIGTTLDDNIYNAVASAKGIILENVPDGNNTPSLYLVGNSDTVTTIFVSEFNARVWFVLTLSHTSKKLSLISTGYTTDVVRYSEGQNLTNTQKDTALSNIGLNWIHVQYSLLGTTLDDATYTKIKNAYGIILTDVPSDYYGPLEFICGANNSDGAKVFTGLNLANTSAYIVLYVNHNLTNVRYARTYDGAVPYDASIDITSAQQDVALSNIGLDFVHVDYSLLNTTLSDADFNRIWNAKGLVILGNDDIPATFIKGSHGSTKSEFYGFNDIISFNYITLSASSKRLSNISAHVFNLGSVTYNTTQTLTDAQKQQARTNIGVKSADELLADADFIAQLKTKLGIG